jgi:hypothetical protein
MEDFLNTQAAMLDSMVMDHKDLVIIVSMLIGSSYVILEYLFYMHGRERLGTICVIIALLNFVPGLLVSIFQLNIVHFIFTITIFSIITGFILLKKI